MDEKTASITGETIDKNINSISFLHTNSRRKA